MFLLNFKRFSDASPLNLSAPPTSPAHHYKKYGVPPYIRCTAILVHDKMAGPGRLPFLDLLYYTFKYLIDQTPLIDILGRR
jgi:hypothetical protein